MTLLGCLLLEGCGGILVGHAPGNDIKERKWGIKEIKAWK